MALKLLLKQNEYRFLHPMKRFLFLLLLIPVFLLAFSNPDQQPMNFSPKYPGGDTAMICLFRNNLNPAIVNDTAFKGDYLLQFIVDSIGNTRDIKITRAPAHSEKAQAEVIRVAKLFAKWEPGYNVNDIYTDEETGKPHYRVAQLNYPVRLPQVARAVCPEKK